MHCVWIARKSLRRGTLNLVQDRIDVRLVYLWLVGQNVAHIVRKRRACLNFLQQFVERLLFIRQLHIRIIGIRFRRWIDLIGAALFQVRIQDTLYLTCRRLLVWGEHRIRRRETRPVKISAQGEMYHQGNNDSEPEPIALPGTAKQTFSRVAVEIVKFGNPHRLEKYHISIWKIASWAI